MFSHTNSTKDILRVVSKYKIILISIVCLLIILLLVYLKKSNEYFYNNNTISLLDPNSNFVFNNTYSNSKPYLLYSSLPNSFEFNNLISITNNDDSSETNHKDLGDTTVLIHALICHNHDLNNDLEQTIFSYALDNDKEIKLYIEDSRLRLKLKNVRCENVIIGFDNILRTNTVANLNFQNTRQLIDRIWYFLSLYIDLKTAINSNNFVNKIKLYINNQACTGHIMTDGTGIVDEPNNVSKTNINSLVVGSVNDTNHILYHHEPLDGTNNRVVSRIISPKGQLVFGNVNRNTVRFKLFKDGNPNGTIGSNIEFNRRQMALQFDSGHSGLTETNDSGSSDVSTAINTALTIDNAAIDNGFTIEMKIKFATGDSTQDLISFQNGSSSVLKVQLIRIDGHIKFKFNKLTGTPGDAEFKVSDDDFDSFSYSEFHKLSVVCKKNSTTATNLDISVYLDNTQLNIVSDSNATLSSANTGLGGLSTVNIGGSGRTGFIGQMKDLYVFNYPFKLNDVTNIKYTTSDNGDINGARKLNVLSGKQVLDLRNKYFLLSRLPKFNSTNFNPNSQYISISLWFNTDKAISSAVWFNLFEFTKGSTTKEIRIYNNRITVDSNAITSSVDNTFKRKKWYNIVLVLSKQTISEGYTFMQSESKIYINGEETSVIDDQDIGSLENLNSLIIGSEEGSENIQGYVTDLKFYNGQISHEQVKKNYFESLKFINMPLLKDNMGNRGFLPLASDIITNLEREGITTKIDNTNQYTPSTSISSTDCATADGNIKYRHEILNFSKPSGEALNGDGLNLVPTLKFSELCKEGYTIKLKFRYTSKDGSGNFGNLINIKNGDISLIRVYLNKTNSEYYLKLEAGSSIENLQTISGRMNKFNTLVFTVFKHDSSTNNIRCIFNNTPIPVDPTNLSTATQIIIGKDHEDLLCDLSMYSTPLSSNVGKNDYDSDDTYDRELYKNNSIDSKGYRSGFDGHILLNGYDLNIPTGSLSSRVTQVFRNIPNYLSNNSVQINKSNNIITDLNKHITGAGTLSCLVNPVITQRVREIRTIDVPNGISHLSGSSDPDLYSENSAEVNRKIDNTFDQLYDNYLENNTYTFIENHVKLQDMTRQVDRINSTIQKNLNSNARYSADGSLQFY